MGFFSDMGSKLGSMMDSASDYLTSKMKQEANWERSVAAKQDVWIDKHLPKSIASAIHKLDAAGDFQALSVKGGEPHHGEVKAAHTPNAAHRESTFRKV